MIVHLKAAHCWTAWFLTTANKNFIVMNGCDSLRNCDRHDRFVRNDWCDRLNVR